MTSPDRAAEFAGATSLFVPVDWVPVTPGEALDRPLRGLRCATGGTVTVKTAGSGAETRDMVFLDGETRWCMITAVDSADASGIEGAV